MCIQAIYGVCLHPKYVGWFALRAVILFHNISVPDMHYTPPKDVLEVNSENCQSKLIENI